MFLLASEISLFRSYFARNWPLLSPSHGFVTLALSMIVLGINMLGNLNKPATSEKSLGLPFWRIVIGSGIIIFILGFVNLIAVSRNIITSCSQTQLLTEPRASSFVIGIKASQLARSALTVRSPSTRRP